MILKQSPEDFQVEELTDFQPGEGPFSLYRLDKSGWTTPDALDAVCRRWRIERRRLSFGGLKDRHAQTTQHFTIYRGPQRKLTHQGFAVAYLGQATEPFTSEKIRANRFSIVLRGVAPAQLSSAQAALEQIRDFGVPNYFDDQRFGSVASGETFIAKCLILERHEEALRLALTSPYEHDRGPKKKAKAILRKHWGDWSACCAKLPPGLERRASEHLVGHPDDFAGALGRLPQELRTLFLSAYQSHLWNRMLAGWLRTNLRPEQRITVALRLGDVPMHLGLDAEQLSALRALSLPLPSPKAVLADDDPRKRFLDGVLRAESLTLEQFKLKGTKDMFFSRGERPALCLPEDLSWEPGTDETRRGQQKLKLIFTLPRGCYATLVVKRLQAGGG